MFEIGKKYKFIVKVLNDDRITVYTGKIISIEGDFIQLLDVYNKNIIINKNDITKAEEVNQ